MKTKPRGIHATFTTDCQCGSELTVTNGRIDPHECHPIRGTFVSDEDMADFAGILDDRLAQLRAAK